MKDMVANSSQLSWRDTSESGNSEYYCVDTDDFHGGAPFSLHETEQLENVMNSAR